MRQSVVEITIDIQSIYIKKAIIYYFCKEEEVMNKTLFRESKEQITVDIEKLSAMLSCGRATARKIGEQAEARICIGRRVLYSVDKIKQYLCDLSE